MSNYDYKNENIRNGEFKLKKCICGKKHNSYVNGVPGCLNCFNILIRFLSKFAS